MVKFYKVPTLEGSNGHAEWRIGPDLTVILRADTEDVLLSSGATRGGRLVVPHVHVLSVARALEAANYRLDRHEKWPV